MQVHKQVVQSAGASTSYGSIFAKTNVGLITMGLVPTFFRNFILLSALQPSKHGIADDTSSVVLAVGAITLSHPFEVARVHQQYHMDMNLDFRPTMNTLYAKEGVAGLYRGLIPRTIHMVPAYMAWIYYNSSFKPSDRISEFYRQGESA